MGYEAYETRAQAPATQTKPRTSAPPPKPKVPGLPTGDTKQALQWDAKPLTVATKLGDASLKVRFELSHRRQGETSVRGEVGGRDGSVRVGETQQVLNRELSLAGEKGAAKFKTALLAVDFELLKDGTLELAGIPVNIKVDAKALEADGAKLYAAKIAIVGEADVSAWFPGPFKVVGQLRLELGVPPSLIAKVYEAKRAANAIEKFGEADRRFREARQALSKRKTWIRKLETRAGEGLSKADAARLVHYREEALVLEQQAAKLKGLRSTLSAAKNRGLQTLSRVGQKLEESALGRLVSRIMGGVVGKILGKVLPLYNIYQTAKDIYELAQGLASIDWSNESMGEYNPEGEVVSGKSPGDGASEAPQGGSKDEGIPEDLMDLSDLEPSQDRLSVMSEQVVSAVRQPSADAGDAAPLSADEIGLINDIVPDDLDATEIAQLQSLVSASLQRSGEQLSLPEAIVGAMQTLRPDGVKRAPQPAPASAPSPAPDAERAPKPKKKVRKAKRKPKPAPKTAPIDLHTYLFDHVALDPTTRRLVIDKREFAIDGVTFKIDEMKVSFMLVAGEDLRPMAYVSVRVDANPSRRPIRGQANIDREAVIMEVFEARTLPAPAQSESSTQRTRP